ncbi:MAG: MqnA/MqnD/SBP family protein, partial [Bryobacteraceae bacterium]
MTGLAFDPKPLSRFCVFGLWYCGEISVPSMIATSPAEIVSAHSPDSDDAFMFYGLATRKIRSAKVSFRHVLEDIESLNRKALDGLYELT